MRPAASPARRMFRAAAPAVAGLAATAGLGLAWGLAEAEARTVRTHRLAVLPAGSAPLRVLHLSDIHLLPRHRAKRAWLRGLDALEPDLVVNTGDNVSAAASVPLVLDALGPLLARASHRPGTEEAEGNTRRDMAPAGVFACAGDDEWCVITVRDDTEWRRLVAVTGLPDDPSLHSVAGRLARRAEHVSHSAQEDPGGPLWIG